VETRRARACTLDSFLKERYAPHMVSRWRSGAGQVARIRAAFPGLLDKRLDEIDAWTIEKWRANKLNKGRTSATVNRDMSALKAALARAVDWNLLPENPLRRVKLTLQDKSAKVRYLTPEEHARLMQALDAREECLRQERESANVWRREPEYDEFPDLPEATFAGHLEPMVILSLNTGARDDALPLYVQKNGARVGKSGDQLAVKVRGKTLQKTRLIETSQVCLFGGAQLTTPAIQQCLARSIPVLYFSHGGWFYGMTQGLGHKNVGLRQAQYRADDDPERCRQLARDLVNVKILNAHTLLRRNHPDPPRAALDALKNLAERATAAESLESLLGIEGMAAKTYFAHFGGLLKPAPPPDHASEAPGLDFAFNHRNRRPPGDPVNAMLSFAYALFTKDWAITLAAVGFDPYLGFYHQPRYGRPALALDMMEPFRPLVPDSVVLWSVNNGVVGPADFLRRGGAVALKNEARRKFILAYEKRMDDLVTHPVFNYRISYRRVLEVQARLLARTLAGEIPRLLDFLTR